jgi:hypothetical protein
VLVVLARQIRYRPCEEFFQIVVVQAIVVYLTGLKFKLQIKKTHSIFRQISWQNKKTHSNKQPSHFHFFDFHVDYLELTN